MFNLVLASILGSLAVISAQVTAPIPILSTDPGVRINPASEGAPVKLEAFIELVCGDSNYSYPILKQLQEYYGPENIDVVLHQLALPYHRQAQLTVQGLYYVMDEDPDNAIPYMDAVFADFVSLTNGATRELSENEVVQLLGEIQESGTGIPAATFADNVFGYGSPAIRAWKYATRRGMAGTPWFVLNNIDLAINPGIRLSFEDWTDFLDTIIDTNKVETKKVAHKKEEKPINENTADVKKSANNHIVKKNDELTNQQPKIEMKEKAKKMASLKLSQLLKIKKYPKE